MARFLAARTACAYYILILVLIGFFTPSSAWAHKVNVFATVEGKTIRGEVYFRGATPAQEAKVEVFDPTGAKLGETTTDSEGKFSFDARFRCDHRLMANAGEGHAGEYTVEAGELPDTLPARDGSVLKAAPSSNTASAAPATELPAVPVPSPSVAADDARLKEIVESAVARQIGLLRRELDRKQDQARMSDVLGGIGYICGIMGLLFFYLGSRKKGGGAHE